METQKWYCAEFGDVKEVEVLEETEKSLRISKNRLVRKDSEYSKYFKTHKEAVDHLIEKLSKEIQRYENSVTYHKEKLEKIKEKFGVE